MKNSTKKKNVEEINEINIQNTKLIETPENCAFFLCSLEIYSKRRHNN